MIFVTVLLFDGGVCLAFHKGNDANLVKKIKSNREKVNLSLNKFEEFSLKKSLRP